MKKALCICLTALVFSLSFLSCTNDVNTPKSYKIYWDITNYSYEPSEEITFLLSTFDDAIAKGSCDSITNHTFVVHDIKYARYKEIREETVALADEANAWLQDNWHPTKRYKVRVYCYCPDDYDYYNTGSSSSTEVWATYTFKKSND